MYKSAVKEKKFWFWIIGTTFGLISGFFAAFLLTLDYLYLAGAICGLCLGFFQGLFLLKLLNKKIFAVNNHILVKWILATTFGMSIGGGITNLFGNLTSNPPLIIGLFIFITIIPLSIAQGLAMDWQKNKIYMWLFANFCGVLASGLFGVLLYFVSAEIAVAITGGGLGAIFIFIMVATLSISLSSGLTFGGITGLFLLRLLNDRKE
jgi:hypothetical protein